MADFPPDKDSSHRSDNACFLKTAYGKYISSNTCLQSLPKCRLDNYHTINILSRRNSRNLCRNNPPTW